MEVFDSFQAHRLVFAWPWRGASVAENAIRASYIHADKRGERVWSAVAGEGEWGCGVWEVPVCYARDTGHTSFLRLHCSANLQFWQCDERRS